MATFKKTEIVDGRQFTGGEQNGTDLTYWVQSGGKQTALWGAPYRSAPETIVLFQDMNQLDYERVFVGDWIIREQDGRFIRVRPEELITDGYEIQ